MMRPLIHYVEGRWKYCLTEEVSFPTGIRNEGFELDWCSIDPEGIATASEGYCWDGATGFPDCPWIIVPSLKHDILCQLLHETEFGYYYDRRRKNADLFAQGRLLRTVGFIPLANWALHREE